jgi:hypothetical protein
MDGLRICLRGLLIAGVAALCLLAGGANQGAQAQGGSGLDPNVVGIDVDPYGDVANTKTSLGSIERCIEVGGVGSTFDIDVFLDDVPFSSGSYHNLGGYEYRMLYDNSKLQVTTTNHNGLMATQGGVGVSDLSDCSSLPGASPCPDVDGSLYTGVVGLGAGAQAEPPGSLGFLDRYQMQVMGGEGTLVYLTLTDVWFGGYEPGVTPWPDEIDQVWDANYTTRYGIIAINTACPGGPTPDADGDTIPDSEDACPNEPEDFDQDEDGCPGFSFAIITDLHLGNSYDLKYEDYDYYPIRRLQRAVQWINEQPQIKLVFVLGDISDDGDKDVLERARKELENLRPGLSFVPLLGNHDVQGGTAQNFKTVFGDLLQRVREIPECGPAGSDDLQNFSFSYRGVRFIGLDFVGRNLGSAALLHTGTRKCLIAALQKPSPGGEPVIILAHHPLLEADEVARLYDPYVPQTAACLRGHVPWQVMTFLNPFAISDLGGLINTFASEREVFTFGGHLHGTRKIGFGEVETCELPVFSANQDLTHTTLGSPVVITEALKNGSNEQNKGFIRIVKVRGTNVDVGQIEGSSMAAVNPDFNWFGRAPCPAGMASLICGLQRLFTRWPVTFQADTYTNRDIDCYMWDFGDACSGDCAGRQEQTYKKGGVYNVCLTVFGKDVATPRLPDEPEGERIQETICRSVTVR